MSTNSAATGLQNSSILIGQRVDKIDLIVQNQQSFISSLLSSLKIIAQGNPTLAYEVKNLTSTYEKSLKKIPTNLPANEFDTTFQNSQRQISEIQAQVLPQTINLEDPESLKDSNIIVQLLGEVTTLKNRMSKMENSRPKATLTSNTARMQEKFHKLKTKANVKWENLNNQISNMQNSVDSLAARDAQLSQEIIRIDALLQSCSVSVSSIESGVAAIQPEKYNLAVKKVKNDVEVIKTAISALQESTPSSEDIDEINGKVQKLQRQIREFPEIQTKLETQQKDLELVKNALKKNVPITTSEEDENEGEKLGENLAIVTVNTTQMLIEAQSKHEAEIASQRLEIDELKSSLAKFALKAPVDTKIAQLTENLEKLQSVSAENFSTIQNNYGAAIEQIQRELGESKPFRGELDKLNQNLSALSSEYHEHQTASTIKLDNLTSGLKDVETSLSSQIQSNNTSVNKRINDNDTDIKQQLLEIRGTLNDRLRDNTDRFTKQIQDYKSETQKEHELIKSNLQNQFNTLKETVNRQIQDYKLKVNEDLNQNKELTSEQIKDIRSNTNSLINQHNENMSSKIQTYQGSMSKRVEDSTSSIKRELESYESATKNQLKEHRETIEQRMQNHQQQTLKAIQENKESQQQSLKNSTETLNARLNDVRETNEKQVKEFREKGEKEIQKSNEEMNKRIKEFQDESRTAISENKEENENKIKEYQSKVNEQIQTTLAELNKQLKDFREEFERQLNENHQTLSLQVKDISQKSDKMIKDTQTSIDDKLEETRKDINNKLADANVEFYRKLEDTEKAVSTKLDQTQTHVIQQYNDLNKITNESFTRQLVDTKQSLDREIEHTQESVKIANEGVNDLKPTHRDINRLKMSIRMMGGEIYQDDGEYPENTAVSRQSSPRRSRMSSRQSSPPSSPKRFINTSNLNDVDAFNDGENNSELIRQILARIQKLENIHKQENEIYEIELQNDPDVMNQISQLENRVKQLEAYHNANALSNPQSVDIVQPTFPDVEEINQKIADLNREVKDIQKAIDAIKNEHKTDSENLRSSLKVVEDEIKILKGDDEQI